jgi:calcineurin-like phosphoesterase family protein
MKKESQIKENREKLKALSNGIKILIKQGVYDSVNEGLAEYYKQTGHVELKKFWDWKKAGKTIKKGEHALLLWGQPRKGKKPEPQEEKDEYSFFPVCYVFSNLQVI